MSKYIRLFALFLLIAISSVSFAKVYKWKDAEGKTHYTATPPPKNIESTEMNVKTGDDKLANKNSFKKLSKNKQKSIITAAKKECKKALKKIPASMDYIKEITEDAYDMGSITVEQRAKTLTNLNKAKAKLPTVSACIADYKTDEATRKLVSCLNEGSNIDGLVCFKKHAGI